MLEVLGKIGFDWQVALANFINFLIIFFLLRRFAFGPIKKIVEDRKKKIDQGLLHAEIAEKNLREANEEKEAILKKALVEAGDTMKKAAIEGEELVRLSKLEGESERHKIIEKARLESDKIFDTNMDNFKKEAAKVYIDSVEKLLKETINKEAATKFAQNVKV